MALGVLRPPGNQEAFFSIGSDSGNLTLRATVPSPQTFELLVKVGSPQVGWWGWVQGSHSGPRPPRPSRWTVPDTQ